MALFDLFDQLTLRNGLFVCPIVLGFGTTHASTYGCIQGAYNGSIVVETLIHFSTIRLDLGSRGRPAN